MTYSCDNFAEQAARAAEAMRSAWGRPVVGDVVYAVDLAGVARYALIVDAQGDAFTAEVLYWCEEKIK